MKFSQLLLWLCNLIFIAFSFPLTMKSALQAPAAGVAPTKKETIPTELAIAAGWWASRTGELSAEQANLFRDNLSSKLLEKYRGHWCIENPMRGNAFRAILFDETTCDRVLANAAQCSYISQFERRLPAEAVVMWVDPGSVSVKYLATGKIKVLYDSTDPQYTQETFSSTSAPAGSQSLETCSQEYSSAQAASTHSNAPTQRV